MATQDGAGEERPQTGSGGAPGPASPWDPADFEAPVTRRSTYTPPSHAAGTASEGVAADGSSAPEPPTAPATPAASAAAPDLHDDDELAAALQDQMRAFTDAIPVVGGQFDDDDFAEALKEAAPSGPASDAPATPPAPAAAAPPAAAPPTPAPPAPAPGAPAPPLVILSAEEQAAMLAGLAGPQGPPWVPERRSLSDEQLAEQVARASAEPGRGLEIMEEIDRQMRIRADEAQEFQDWEQSMRSIGTPEALASVEDVRRHFDPVLQSTEFPVPAPGAAASEPPVAPAASAQTPPTSLADAPPPAPPTASAAPASPTPPAEPTTPTRPAPAEGVREVLRPDIVDPARSGPREQPDLDDTIRRADLFGSPWPPPPPPDLASAPPPFAPNGVPFAPPPAGFPDASAFPPPSSFAPPPSSFAPPPAPPAPEAPPAFTAPSAADLDAAPPPSYTPPASAEDLDAAPPPSFPAAEDGAAAARAAAGSEPTVDASAEPAPAPSNRSFAPPSPSADPLDAALPPLYVPTAAQEADSFDRLFPTVAREQAWADAAAAAEASLADGAAPSEPDVAPDAVDDGRVSWPSFDEPESDVAPPVAPDGPSDATAEGMPWAATETASAPGPTATGADPVEESFIAPEPVGPSASSVRPEMSSAPDPFPAPDASVVPDAPAASEAEPDPAPFAAPAPFAEAASFAEPPAAVPPFGAPVGEPASFAEAPTSGPDSGTTSPPATESDALPGAERTSPVPASSETTDDAGTAASVDGSGPASAPDAEAAPTPAPTQDDDSWAAWATDPVAEPEASSSTSGADLPADAQPEAVHDVAAQTEHASFVAPPFDAAAFDLPEPAAPEFAWVPSTPDPEADAPAWPSFDAPAAADDAGAAAATADEPAPWTTDAPASESSPAEPVAASGAGDAASEGTTAPAAASDVAGGADDDGIDAPPFDGAVVDAPPFEGAPFAAPPFDAHAVPAPEFSRTPEGSSETAASATEFSGTVEPPVVAPPSATESAPPAAADSATPDDAPAASGDPSGEAPSPEPSSSSNLPAFDATAFDAPTFPSAPRTTSGPPQAADEAAAGVTDAGASAEAPADAEPATPIADTAGPLPLAWTPPTFDGPAAEDAEPESRAVDDAPLGASSWTPPAFDAPTFDAPAVDAPAFEAPTSDAPTFDAPAFEAPTSDAPAFDAPAFDVPTSDAAETSTPAADPLAFDPPAWAPPSFDAPVVDEVEPEVSAPETPAAEAGAPRHSAATEPAAGTDVAGETPETPEAAEASEPFPSFTFPTFDEPSPPATGDASEETADAPVAEPSPASAFPAWPTADAATASWGGDAVEGAPVDAPTTDSSSAPGASVPDAAIDDAGLPPFDPAAFAPPAFAPPAPNSPETETPVAAPPAADARASAADRLDPPPFAPSLPRDEQSTMVDAPQPVDSFADLFATVPRLPTTSIPLPQEPPTDATSDEPADAAEVPWSPPPLVEPPAPAPWTAPAFDTLDPEALVAAAAPGATDANAVTDDAEPAHPMTDSVPQLPASATDEGTDDELVDDPFSIFAMPSDDADDEAAPADGDATATPFRFGEPSPLTVQPHIPYTFDQLLADAEPAAAPAPTWVQPTEAPPFDAPGAVGESGATGVAGAATAGGASVGAATGSPAPAEVPDALAPAAVPAPTATPADAAAAASAGAVPSRGSAAARIEVEDATLAPTPEDRRVARAVQLFWTWFAPNASLITVALGACLIGAGLSLRQSIIAALAGVALGAIPLGIGTLVGRRSGLPGLIVSRATFGVRGGALPALVSLIARLVFGGGLLWILGATVASVLDGAQVTTGLDPGTLTLVVSVVGGILALVIAFVGHALIARVQLVIAIISAVLVIGFIVLSASHVNLDRALQTPDGALALAVGGAVLVFSVLALAWANGASDVARYQRGGGAGAAPVLSASLGAGIPALVLVAWGAVLAASDPSVLAALTTDPADALGRLLPSWALWYPAPVLLGTALSLLSGAIMSVYSGAFALASIGPRLRQPVAIVIAAVLVILVGAGLGSLGGQTVGTLRDLATTLAVPVAAWVGMMTTELLVRRRPYHAASLLTTGGIYPTVRWTAIAGLVLISVIGFGLTSATTPGLDWQGFLTTAGLVPAPLTQGDIGVIVALVLGLVAPFGLTLPALRREETGVTAHEG